MIAVSSALVAVVTGLGVAALLFLVASGLTLVFGVMKILNLAHGAFFMAGAFAIYEILSGVQVSSIVFAGGVVGAAIVVAAIGAVSERLYIRIFYDRTVLDSLVGTYALLLILRGGAAVVWGAQPRSAPGGGAVRGSLEFMGVIIPQYRVVLLCIALLVLLGLHLLIRRTRLGAEIRAVSEDRWMASVLGIHPQRTSLTMFVLGALLAGLGGALAVPIMGITPSLAVDFVIPALQLSLWAGWGASMVRRLLPDA